MANLHYIPLLITTEVGNNGETFVDWDSANEYQAFTVVKYLSDFYISIDNVDPYTLITDTDYWIKITGSSTAGVTWGNITGVLSNQTDLYNALAAKEDSANLAAVATSGDYSDLNGTPNLAAVATTGDYDDLSNTPNLATVATTGDYDDLSNTPNLAAVATSGSYNDLSNKPNLATVATSGSYNDLSNKPNLAAVATSGSYNDLSNTPTLPIIESLLTSSTAYTSNHTFTLSKNITDYDLLLVNFKCSDNNTLGNARMSQLVSVNEIEKYLTTSNISGGVNCHEFIYCYPSASPSWYCDVAWGFTAANKLYASRRTYSNMSYWTISSVYGIKF